MSEEMILEPLADAGEVAKKPTDNLWTYSEETKESNKIVETNGVTFPLYGTSDDNEQIGTSVDGKPVYVGDRYWVKVEWKDMVHNFDTRTWDTTDLKWDFPQGAWDNLSEHNEIKITNYSSQAIDVTFDATPNPGFESITYSFDKAANTDDPVETLRIAAADQGKSGKGEDLNVPQEATVYLNLHGIPPEAIGKDISELIGQVTVRINDFTKDKPQAGITLDKAQLNLDELDVSEQLTATFIPENPQDDTTLTWTSSDETIATVDSDGNVTSVSNGSAVITVTNADGKYSTQCTVTVNTEGFPSPYLFSNFDTTNHTVSIAGLVDNTTVIKDVVIPREISITSKISVGNGKFSVVEKNGGESYSIIAVAANAFQNLSNLIGTLTIPDSVLSIKEYAFGSCNFLTGNLNIPDSVTSIERRAFYGCQGFQGSLNLSNTLTSIGAEAFGSCIQLTSLTLPHSLTFIGNEAFRNCYNLRGPLNLPTNLISIGDSAFNGCIGFTGSLKIPDSVTFIGASAFYGCRGFQGDLTIPPLVNTISDYAFYYCTGLDGDLKLSNSLTTIGKLAFGACTSIKNLIIPNSVTSINEMAFRYLYSLVNIILPSSLTSISSTAFENCNNLQKITVEKPQDSISGAPWGAVNATVNWVG